MRCRARRDIIVYTPFAFLGHKGSTERPIHAGYAAGRTRHSVPCCEIDLLPHGESPSLRRCGHVASSALREWVSPPNLLTFIAREPQAQSFLRGKTHRLDAAVMATKRIYQLAIPAPFAVLLEWRAGEGEPIEDATALGRFAPEQARARGLELFPHALELMEEAGARRG